MAKAARRLLILLALAPALSGCAAAEPSPESLAKLPLLGGIVSGLKHVDDEAEIAEAREREPQSREEREEAHEEAEEAAAQRAQAAEDQESSP
jgi:hypothetical protein